MISGEIDIRCLAAILKANESERSVRAKERLAPLKKILKKMAPLMGYEIPEKELSEAHTLAGVLNVLPLHSGICPYHDSIRAEITEDGSSGWLIDQEMQLRFVQLLWKDFMVQWHKMSPWNLISTACVIYPWENSNPPVCSNEVRSVVIEILFDLFTRMGTSYPPALEAAAWFVQGKVSASFMLDARNELKTREASMLAVRAACSIDELAFGVFYARTAESYLYPQNPPIARIEREQASLIRKRLKPSPMLIFR